MKIYNEQVLPTAHNQLPGYENDPLPENFDDILNSLGGFDKQTVERCKLLPNMYTGHRPTNNTYNISVACKFGQVEIHRAIATDIKNAEKYPYVNSSENNSIRSSMYQLKECHEKINKNSSSLSKIKTKTTTTKTEKFPHANKIIYGTFNDMFITTIKTMANNAKLKQTLTDAILYAGPTVESERLVRMLQKSRFSDLDNPGLRTLRAKNTYQIQKKINASLILNRTNKAFINKRGKIHITPTNINKMKFERVSNLQDEIRLLLGVKSIDLNNKKKLCNFYTYIMIIYHFFTKKK